MEVEKGKALAYKIYLQLKDKYAAYQFDEFIDILQLEHCVIIFRKNDDRGELKFMIEISTDNFKVFRREIALYRPGSEISEIIKDFEEYENILADARKVAKGKLIS